MISDRFRAHTDDVTFGILHSRFHVLWSLRFGISLEDHPCHTSSTVFEAFPFPAGMTPCDTTPRSGQASLPCMADEIVLANIAAAARRLNELSEAWLEADLKKRTLANLYNVRPVWLDLVCRELDKAVAAAYGWTDYTPAMSDDEILSRLLALNPERSGPAYGQ